MEYMGCYVPTASRVLKGGGGLLRKSPANLLLLTLRLNIFAFVESCGTQFGNRWNVFTLSMGGGRERELPGAGMAWCSRALPLEKENKQTNNPTLSQLYYLYKEGLRCNMC